MRDDFVDEPTADAIGPAIPIDQAPTKRGRKPPPPNDAANPRPHPDQYEIQRRIEYMLELVILGLPKVEVRRNVAANKPKWQIAERTFDEYWRKLQALLQKDADRSRQREVAKALQRNELVFKKAMARKNYVGETAKEVEDPDLKAALLANAQNARLLGLEAPKVTKLSNDPDNPLPTPELNATVNAAVSITFVESDE